MRKLLYIKCSPRGAASRSIAAAEAFLPAYLEAHPGAKITEVDIWTMELPEYDGDAAAAKMSFFGETAMNETQQTLYDRMIAIFNEFNAADDYLFAIPLWNFGVPYKLKQYIDILTMPGTLFGFDPAVGYLPLLKGKRATAVYSAAIYDGGASTAWGFDHASNHVRDWLNFAGVSDVETIWHTQYKMVGPDEAAAKLEAAREAVRAAARRPVVAPLVEPAH